MIVLKRDKLSDSITSSQLMENCTTFLISIRDKKHCITWRLSHHHYKTSAITANSSELLPRVRNVAKKMQRQTGKMHIIT